MHPSAVRMLFWGSLLFGVVLFSGCSVERFYVPDPEPIPHTLGLKEHFKSACSVHLVNGQTSTRKVHIGDYSHKWWANLRFWTDSCIELLTEEFKERGVESNEESPVKLILALTKADLYWGIKKVGCVVNLEVRTGHGYTVNIEERNLAKDLHDAADGAVSKAVARIFKDRTILEYLAGSEETRDSDCDGVIDGLDRCPNTSLGLVVDRFGCPPDSDGDGVPDHRDDCPGTPEGWPVDGRGCPRDSDGDGVPDALDECPCTPEGVEVDDKGCALDSDGDGVADPDDYCPGTPEGAHVDEYGCWNSQVPLFDFDKSVIKPEYYLILDNVAQILRENPDLKIEIQGHADIIGPSEYNVRLSRRRSKAVREYLVNKGIARERLTIHAYGENQPRAPSDTERTRALNRRVEFRPIH
ncbi:MAG: OmpA family protein [Desulfohalobiaceae bacterium]|nr:OmpA family protein [Desulfohalobiaceae bacterium]